MTSENGNGRNGNWRNLVIGILVSILLTGATAWIAFGTQTVRRDELKDLKTAVWDLQAAVVRLQTTTAVLADRLGPRTVP